MIKLRLTAVNALNKTTLVPELSQEDFPDEVLGSIETYEGGELIPPNGGIMLLVTDDAELAEKAQSDDTGRIHILFVGEPSHLRSAGKAADNICSPSYGGELLKKKYLALVKALRDEFCHWFYKSTLLTTIDTVPDMLWYKRIDGIHMMVNNAFTEIVHKPKDDVIGKDHFYIWDAPRPAEGNEFACAESEEIAISTGKTYICDEPVKTREGMKQFTTYKTPVYDMFGNVFGTVGLGHDVTNFSNLGIELSILIENMPFPMTIFTPDWKVVRMNNHFREIVGAESIDDFNYRVWKETVPIPAGKPTEDKLRHSSSREYHIQLNGELHNFMLTELEIRDYFDNVSGYFCTMQDITYQRAYEQSIIQAANTDMLTGMYNRRYFYNFLSGNIGRPFYLLYLDIDRFKAINDNYGHNIGDEVLIKTSELINEYFPDSVTARLGGDEFAIIDENNSIDEINSRCKILENAVLEEFKQYNCGTTISIGIAYTDGNANDIDRIIQESDTKMYEIKKEHHKA